MSKIEDALNKIKTSNSKGIAVTKNDEASDLKKSNTKDLTTSNSRIVTTVNHNSSVKEIARMKNSKLLASTELSELKIIFSDMPDSKIANTYRDLRTKLIQKSQGRNISVLLTSCTPDYLSNMNAINLAAAFSLDESKTSLLIDCNLSNPQLADILDLKGSLGLTDYLESEDVEVDSILHESGIKRLRVIPAGKYRETATEYFTSIRMKGLMTDLLSRYSDRYVFIDAAPISESADTRILVEMCDYVLLVVPYGRATKARVKEAAEAIDKDKLLGVIFADKPAVPSFNAIGKVKSSWTTED